MAPITWFVRKVWLPLLVALTVPGCEEDGGVVAIIQYQVQEQDRIGEDAERLASYIRLAARNGAKLVVTPETSLHRYIPYSQNGVSMAELAAEFDAQVARYAGLAADLGITLIVGLREPAGGGKTFNTAVCLGPDGSILGQHRKFLPSKGEIGYTVSGRRLTVVSTPVGRIGLVICKDLYSPTVQNGYAPGTIDLFVLIAADEDARNFPIGPFCERVGCKGVLANQAFGAGNSAVAGADGSVDYFGGGEGIFYTELP